MDTICSIRHEANRKPGLATNADFTEWRTPCNDRTKTYRRHFPIISRSVSRHLSEAMQYLSKPVLHLTGFMLYNVYRIRAACCKSNAAPCRIARVLATQRHFHAQLAIATKCWNCNLVAVWAGLAVWGETATQNGY